MSLEDNLSAKFYLKENIDDTLNQHNGFNLQGIVFSNDAEAGPSGRDVATFDGNASFDISADLFTSVNTKYSLSMWIKSSGWTQADQPLIHDHDNDNIPPNSSDSMFFWIEGANTNPANQGKIMVQHRGPNLFGVAHPRATVGSASAVAENVWVHIGITWDKGNGSNGETKIYINGQLDATRVNNQEPWDSVASARVAGHRGAPDFQGFVGSMANLNFWVERTLDAADMLALYNQGINSPWDPLHGMQGVKRFCSGRDLQGNESYCYLRFHNNETILVATNDVIDTNRLRPITLNGTSAPNSISYLTNGLIYVSFDDGSVQIGSVESGSEWASGGDPNAFSSVSLPNSKLIKRCFTGNANIQGGDESNYITAIASDKTIYTIGPISQDGSNYGSVTLSSLDINAINAFEYEVYDMAIDDQHAVFISKRLDGPYGYIVNAFDLTNGNSISLNSLPFTPKDVNTFVYNGSRTWVISDGENTASASSLAEWA